uniref:Uncharacterized protein n=1 Tax=Podoviridae sp. ctHMt20 TaxID=2827728 RepID=A0A8S5SLH1_9CAUD|nr:MAG TPA: hypothetical protein [Podoviridae sp. ctHMt20]
MINSSPSFPEKSSDKVYKIFDNKKKHIYNEDTQEDKTSLQLVLCGFFTTYTQKPRIFIDARFFVYSPI